MSKVAHKLKRADRCTGCAIPMYSMCICGEHILYFSRTAMAPLSDGKKKIIGLIFLNICAQGLKELAEGQSFLLSCITCTDFPLSTTFKGLEGVKHFWYLGCCLTDACLYTDSVKHIGSTKSEERRNVRSVLSPFNLLPGKLLSLFCLPVFWLLSAQLMV